MRGFVEILAESGLFGVGLGPRTFVGGFYGVQQFLSDAAELAQRFGPGSWRLFAVLPLSCIALPRGKDLQAVGVGEAPVSDNIGWIAVISGRIEFSVLDKFGFFHCRSGFRAPGQGNARLAATFRIPGRLETEGKTGT
jgi:hypothetical protein